MKKVLLTAAIALLASNVLAQTVENFDHQFEIGTFDVNLNADQGQFTEELFAEGEDIQFHLPIGDVQFLVPVDDVQFHLPTGDFQLLLDPRKEGDK